MAVTAVFSVAFVTEARSQTRSAAPSVFQSLVRSTSVSLAESLVSFSPEDICQYYPAPYAGQEYLRVPDESAASGKQATATFNVTYSGFTAEAEAAFQRAVNT